jgi:hypothetical protein
MARDRRVVITPQVLQDLQGTQLQADIDGLLRRPFRRELARILGCRPTDAAILKFSKRFPDRWGQLVAIFGRLAGYSEKIEVESNLAREINTLSDAEVLARLESVERELESAKTQRALPADRVLEHRENIELTHNQAYATGDALGDGPGRRQHSGPASARGAGGGGAP